MSNDAKTLMFWVSQANVSVADNGLDREYCLECARKWASFLIAGI